MAGSAYYSTGTASIAEGERIVTGFGTGWLTQEGRLSPIKAGDKFGIHVGRPILIESVDSNTTLTLSDPWPGPSQEAAPYKVELTNPQIIAIDAMRRLFASLSSGNLTSLAGLQLDDQQIPISIGPGVFGTIAKDDLVQAVKFDAEVSALADRAAYDGAAKGFRVLVANIGNNRSAFYTKRSATAADWSAPFYVSGVQGLAGPLTELTFGPVTTLPFGQPASVNVVQVDADTVRLDLSLPKGKDGSGTGNVVGPSASVAGRLASFAGADGDQIADSGVPASGLLRSDVGQVLTAAQKKQLAANAGYDPLAGMRNKIINPLGAVNQRGVAGTVTLAPGAYGHDRFKAGANGCTYSFSTANGVTTFNITAGSLQQVIEAAAFSGEAGTYILWWVGTARGRINNGNYGAAGSVSATCDGSANVTVEWNAGTLSLMQFEKGYLGDFAARHVVMETVLCQRYAQTWQLSLVLQAGSAGQGLQINFVLMAQMRNNPTAIQTAVGLTTNVSDVAVFPSFRNVTAQVTSAAAGNVGVYNRFYLFDAEL
jgi:hypothetical protein